MAGEQEPEPRGETAEQPAETPAGEQEPRGETAEQPAEIPAGEESAQHGQRKREAPAGEESAQHGQRKREAPATAAEIPQGRPKSGRVWKENKKRFSHMVRDRPLRTSWEVKMKQRQEKKLLKGLAQQIKDEKQQEKEEKKKRREENLRRRLENERRAEVVQVIRNPAKLKRARKKDLRTIEKRDTLMMSQAGKKLQQNKSAPSRKTKKKEAVST